MAVQPLYGEEHEAFGETVRRFVAKHVEPHTETWELAGAVDRELFRQAAADGLLGFGIAEEYGGGVDDFRFDAVMAEELGRSAASSGMARDYEDARISTIYGGTTEIMKEIVGRGSCL